MLITTIDHQGCTLHIHDAHITAISEIRGGGAWVYLTDGNSHRLPANAARDLIDALHPAKASSLADIRRAAQRANAIQTQKIARWKERNGQ